MSIPPRKAATLPAAHSAPAYNPKAYTITKKISYHYSVYNCI